MKFLIDTHIFIWFIQNSPLLSQSARDLIEDANSEVLISIASIWEISIKFALGKLQIKGTFESVIDDINENSIILLPVNFLHTLEQTKLPVHHRDPFDSIIASQGRKNPLWAL